MRFDPDGDIPFQLDIILNGGVSVDEHVDGAILELTTTGEVQEIQHGLGRTPLGFIVISKTAECDIWTAQLSSWNSESLFLNSSVSSVETRLVVV